MLKTYFYNFLQIIFRGVLISLTFDTTMNSVSLTNIRACKPCSSNAHHNLPYIFILMVVRCQLSLVSEIRNKTFINH